MVDYAFDWGICEPLGVAKTAKLALARGIPEDQVKTVCYGNAASLWSKRQMNKNDWLNPPPADVYLYLSCT